MGSLDYKKIPPHTIPSVKDQWREVQIPLHDYVDNRPPPPGWNPDGSRQDDKNPQRPYNPDVPRWDM